MATDELVVKITGRDGLTQTFVAVGKQGRAAGVQIEQGAKQGAAGLKQLDEAAKKSARSFDDVIDATTKAATAIGLAIGVVGKLGQASVREANSVRSLGLAYGDATDDILAFTESIQDNSRFSNDAARDAALLGSTLTREYGLSAEQAQELLQRSADLAQVYGFSLPDAMNRGASAIRGEAEAAEQMGVAMADSVLQATAAAQGIDNWTTSATEAEKAAVRFDEFMRQTAFVDGSAALAAETTAGKVAHLKNELQDAATAVGGFLGPVGEVASELSTYGFALAGASTGIGALNAGYRAIVPAATAAAAANTVLAASQTSVAVTGVAAQAASLGIIGALAPLGIAAAAAAATLGYLYLTHGADDYSAATESATEQTESLTVAVYNLGKAQHDTTLLLQAQTIAESFDLIEEKVLAAGVAYELWKETQKRSAEDVLGEQRGPNGNLQEQAEAAVDAIEAEDAAMRAATLTVEQLTELQLDLNTAIANTGPGAAAAGAVILEMIGDWQAGTITAQELATGVDIVTDNLVAYDEQAIKAAGSTTTLTAATEEQTAALLAQAGALSDVNEIYGTLRQAGVEQSTQTSRQVQLWLDEQHAIDAQNEAAERAAEYQRLRNHVVAESLKGGNDLLSVLDALRVKHGEVAPAVIAATAALDAERDAIVGLITDLGQMPSAIDQMVFGLKAMGEPSLGPMIRDLAHMARLVGAVTTSTETLGTSTRIIIDGTNRLGAELSGLDDWATTLIDVEGEQGRINELLSRQVITQEEANAAYGAATRIITANAAAQDDLLSIQTQQAPFLAELAEVQAMYLNDLASEPPELQRIALGWMDVAEAQKAQQAVALAATADNERSQAVITETIQQLVDADPILRSMLEGIGLITTDRQGNITVNFDNAESLQSTITELTESIDLLTDAILGVPPGTTWRFHAEGTEEIRAAQQALTDLYAIASQRIPDADFTRLIQAPDSRSLPTPPPATGTAYPRAPASLPLPAPPPVTTPGMRGVAGGYVASAPLAPPPMAARATFDAGEAMAGLAMLKDRLSELQQIQLDIEPTINVDLVRRGFKSIGDGAETINDLDIEPVADLNTRPFDQGALSVFRASAALDSTSSTVSVGLVGAGGVISGLASVQNFLNALNGRTATTYVQTIYTTGGAPGGLGEFQHGGLVSPEAIARAQHGLMPGGQYSWVGEAGRELVKLPQGSLVTPHTASMAATKGRGGAGTINNYGTIHVSAPNADVASAIGSYFRGQGR